jgi:hypothetical protein
MHWLEISRVSPLSPKRVGGGRWGEPAIGHAVVASSRRLEL